MVLDVNHLCDLTKDEQDTLLKLSPGDDRAKVYGQRLIDCAKAGDLFGVEFLLVNGTDINFQDKYGMTALHHAAATSYRPCIRVLTSFNECSYLLQDYKGRYASDLAFEWSKDYAVGLLLQKKQVRQAYAQGVPAWNKPV
ncbi:Ankyrin repeats (3 copies) [compost metagenome]